MTIRTIFRVLGLILVILGICMIYHGIMISPQGHWEVVKDLFNGRLI